MRPQIRTPPGGAAERNRDIVRTAFDERERGSDRFSGILAPDATWTIKGSGPSARSRLGHASVTITLTVYGHVMPGDQKRAADRFAVLVAEA